MNSKSDADNYRKKANELLDEATRTANFKEQSRLISEATRWHFKAMAADHERTAAQSAESLPLSLGSSGEADS